MQREVCGEYLGVGHALEARQRSAEPIGNDIHAVAVLAHELLGPLAKVLEVVHGCFT